MWWFLGVAVKSVPTQTPALSGRLGFTNVLCFKSPNDSCHREPEPPIHPNEQIHYFRIIGIKNLERLCRRRVFCRDWQEGWDARMKWPSMSSRDILPGITFKLST